MLNRVLRFVELVGLGVMLGLGSLLLILMACTDNSLTRAELPPPIATPTPVPCGDKVTYEGSVKSLLLTNCAGAGCHNAAPFPYAEAKAKFATADFGILARVKAPVSDARHMPRGIKVLSANQVALLEGWARDGFLDNDCGAQGPASTRPRPISGDEQIIKMTGDVFAQNANRRKTRRFLTGVHLDEVEGGRFLAAKVLNSLSRDGRLFPVEGVGDEAVWGIDVDDLGLGVEGWEVVALEASKQSVLYVTDAGRQLQAITGTKFPALRADLFASIALRDPVYRKIQPVFKGVLSQAQLEAKLGLNKAAEYRQQAPILSGFEGRPKSGVAIHNRLVTVLQATNGVFSETFDFRNEGFAEEVLGQFPLLASLMGGVTSFKHGGGELIFALPNGLHGYSVVNNRERFLNEVPIDIATNNLNANDPTVRNALRCFQCHARGLYAVPHNSVLDGLVVGNPAIPEGDRQIALALYREDTAMADAVAQANVEYAAAVKRLGGDVYGDEPVTKYVGRFEDALLSLEGVALEVGRSATGRDGIDSCIRANANLAAQFAGLFGKGPGITRLTFASNFPLLVAACQLGQERQIPR